nr:twin-arginine translocation pathway signal [Thermoflexibacter sp.]
MNTSRRNFLRQSSLATVGGMLIPSFLKSLELRANPLAQDDKILVIIQLSGGNDGLNTIVPYYNDVYYRSRPSIAIQKEKVLKINDELGFNPAMQKFKELYEEGFVSIINSV